MFNSPLHYCTKCRAYVALDQSVFACAREHGCGGEPCPLRDLFREPSAPSAPARPPGTVADDTK